MMKSFLFLLTIMFFPLFMIGQSVGEIKGKIVEPDDPLGVIGAHVYVEISGEQLGDITDVNGRFTLKPLNPGVYNVYVTYTGYKTRMVAGINVNPDKITFLGEIEIVPGVQLKEIDVLWFKDKLINPEDPGKKTISGDKMVKIPDRRNLSKMLTNLSTDVQVSEDGENIFFRGSRSGTTGIYVDGVKRESLSNALPGNAVGSMTVYAGGIPAKYGDLTGGAIIIETKSYFDLLNAYRAEQSRRKSKYEESLK